MNQALLDILRCPDEHHAALDYDADADTLVCTECGRVFRIDNGSPVMLLEESRPSRPDAS